MIRRGDVFLVNLDPVIGSEVGKTRPAVIVQNDLANRSRESKVLCEQIRTVFQKRLLQRLGQLSPERLGEIRAALERHLWF